MDWTKAKSILIIALIMTNLILGFNLFKNKSKLEMVSVETVEDTLRILQDRNIYVDIEDVPRETIPMPVLKVEYDHFGADAIDKLIQNQNIQKQDQLSDKEIIETVTHFLRKNELLNENTKLESIEPHNNQHVLTYKNFYKDILLEECHMTCIVKDGQILSIDRIWLNPLEEGQQVKTKKKTIPATTALLKFTSQKTEKGKVYITSIDLVYWLKTSVYSQEITSQDTARPAWKISYNDGKSKDTEYILAFEN